jgi:two-component system LytT family response regulator
MSAAVRAFIVDDEPHARLRLRKLLQGHPEIEIVQEIERGADAVEAIERDHPELVFLDIQLPDFDAFEVLKTISWRPCVIFTTGFDSYALQAFHAAGTDYLLKPVEPQALEGALKKFEQLRRSPQPDAFEKRIEALIGNWTGQPARRYLQRLAIRLGERILLVDIQDVSHFFAKDKYTFLRTTAGKEYIVSSTIAELEEQLDPETFIRVHRSTLVNVNHIREIQVWFGGKYRIVLADKEATEVVVSKNMAGRLKSVIPF